MTVFIEETQQENDKKKDALELIDKVKKLNFTKINYKVLEMLDIPRELINVLTKMQYNEIDTGYISFKDCMLKFMEMAYENGVNNHNPFVKYYFTFNSQIMKELELTKKTFESSKKIKEKELLAKEQNIATLRNLISLIKGYANKIEKGSIIVKETGESRISKIIEKSIETDKILKLI